LVNKENAGDLGHFEVEGISYKPEGSIKGIEAKINDENLKEFLNCASICNESKLLVKEDGSVKISGLPTEAALKVLVEKVGIIDKNFKRNA